MGLQQCPHVKYFGTNRIHRLVKMFLVKSNTMLPCLPSHVFNAAWSSKDRLKPFYKSNGYSQIPSGWRGWVKSYIASWLHIHDCKMSPPKLVIFSAIRRPAYKPTVVPNIYITTCYVLLNSSFVMWDVLFLPKNICMVWTGPKCLYT